ncbi:ankyrin repeat-containing domain protein [Cercophora samala]|uniref:Ankyrin repeat-containing domain protein n=1 Tax=Cercophora samala TaxID=330535 RepID=A0AA40D835_9PEZI|nr:ankyrin repeat-containing domain protein [Cercophora samala]
MATAIADIPQMVHPELDILFERAADFDEATILNRLTSIVGHKPTERQVVSLWKGCLCKPDQKYPESRAKPSRDPPHQDQDRPLPLLKAFTSTASELWAPDATVELAPSTKAYMLSWGLSPLGSAAAQGNLEIAKLLIENANAPDIAKMGLPLRLAARYNHPEIIRLLMAAGAEVDAKPENSTSGKTAMWLAMQENCPDAAKELLKHKPEVNVTWSNMTMLWLAIRDRHEDLFQDLLDAGADPTLYRGSEILPPLVAVCVTTSEIGPLKKLFLYNLKVDDKTDCGMTPLHWIDKRTTVETVKLVIGRGFPVNVADEEGLTPLSKALLCKNLEVVRYLVLEGGADVNKGCMGRHGSTLHIACNEPGLGLEWVKFLVDHGFRINYGLALNLGTAFQATCLRRGDDDGQKQAILRYLVNRDRFSVQAGQQRFSTERGATWIGSTLSAAILGGAELDIVKKLIELGDEVIIQDAIGRRPIHFTAYRGVAYVECLVQAGASLDDKDLLGRNMLHMAVLGGHLDVVKYILNHNKDLVHAVDHDGWTPLLWAMRQDKNWGVNTAHLADIVQELLRCGASRLVKGNTASRTWSAFELARVYGRSEDIVNLVTPTEDELRSMAHNDRKSWLTSIKYSKLVSWRMKGFTHGDFTLLSCDACLLCHTCDDYSICFKCHRSALHGRIHRFPTHQLKMVPEPESDFKFTAFEEEIDEEHDEGSSEGKAWENPSAQNATKSGHQEGKNDSSKDDKEDDTGKEHDQSWVILNAPAESEG